MQTLKKLKSTHCSCDCNTIKLISRIRCFSKLLADSDNKNTLFCDHHSLAIRYMPVVMFF